MTVKEQLIREIEKTPDDHLWEQVLDFALFLQAKNQQTNNNYPTNSEIAKLAKDSGAFDFLQDEPDLYSLSDGEPV